MLEVPQHFYIILSEGLVVDLWRSPPPRTPGGLPAAGSTITTSYLYIPSVVYNVYMFTLFSLWFIFDTTHILPRAVLLTFCQEEGGGGSYVTPWRPHLRHQGTSDLRGADLIPLGNTATTYICEYTMYDAFSVFFVFKFMGTQFWEFKLHSSCLVPTS